jgi:uracil-DNA glycosylase
MTPQPLRDMMDPGWAEALEPVEPKIREMGAFLRAEVAAGRTYLPAGDLVLRAFQQPFTGNPVGLSFSVPPKTRIPASLINIFREYCEDLGYPRPSSGDLSPWTERGIMLLNRALTVQPGRPASHRGKGWETVTDQAITALAGRGTPLVAILWGRDARSLVPLLAGHDKVAWVESAHPSPNSADRGFFGSRPFSRANQLLEKMGGDPVDWRLP